MECPSATHALPDEEPESQGCLIAVTEGPDAGREIDLARGYITIGTSGDCDLTLNDAAVSSFHLRVEVESRGIRIRDLGSTNGTRYLGTRVVDAFVRHGATLRIGRSILQLRAPSRLPATSLSDRESYGSLIGASASMRRLYRQLEALEPHDDVPIIISGETGTGKELVARAIHAHSLRAGKPYLVFDCAGVSENLLASELFGHVRGAFTGATGQRQGVFERCRGGTVFIDELGELPLEMQPKLLRVLETGSVLPLGASQRVDCQFRPIAATHRDLEEMVRDGNFREDLLFRMNVLRVHVPPLRHRREDIPLLMSHFQREMGLDDPSLSPETVELFVSGYDWPGNIRELRNAMHRARLGHPPEPTGKRGRGDRGLHVDLEQPLAESKKRLVEAFELDYLVGQLERSQGNIGQAARSSRMDRSQFKRLMRKHGLLPKRS